MHDQLKQAFDSIQASDALKTRTRTFLAKETNGYARRPLRVRPLLSAVACLLVLLLGGYWLYFTPTAAISMDINPSIVLEVNRFDRVLTVEGINADGERLADVLDVQYLNSADAVSQILQAEPIATLLSENEVMTIAVVGPKNAQCQRLLSQVETCTADRDNTYCYAAQEEDVEQARALGLSYGKYRALLELQTLDPNITAEDIRSMTMREIRNWIAALSSEDTANQASPEPGSGHQGYGSGQYGNRWGWRNQH